MPEQPTTPAAGQYAFGEPWEMSVTSGVVVCADLNDVMGLPTAVARRLRHERTARSVACVNALAGLEVPANAPVGSITRALNFEALASHVLGNVVAALVALPGFEHHEGNGVADDVRAFGERLAERAAAPGPEATPRVAGEALHGLLGGDQPLVHHLHGDAHGAGGAVEQIIALLPGGGAS